MTVIVEVRVARGEFELGRILRPPDGTELVVDRLAGKDRRTVSVWATGEDADELPATASDREQVEDIRCVERLPDGCLYAVEWDPEADDLIEAIDRVGGRLIEGRTTVRDWTLQLRFADEEAFGSFVEHCRSNGVAVEVERRFGVDLTGRVVDGLTDRQRETLSLAVKSGYYDIPRQTTTKELGDELGVSDQAVTERLRRAIGTLVDRTLHADADD